MTLTETAIDSRFATCTDKTTPYYETADSKPVAIPQAAITVTEPEAVAA